MSIPGSPWRCLWVRSRVEPHVQGALGARATRAVAAHLERCPPCRARADGLLSLRSLVRSVAEAPEEPDWTTFWPAIRQRILTEPRRPIREAWWRPFWTPVWGHPRLALGTVAAAALLLSLSLWPGGERELALAGGAPVVVQEAAVLDPQSTVMVYSTREEPVTVIWVFGADTPATRD